MEFVRTQEITPPSGESLAYDYPGDNDGNNLFTKSPIGHIIDEMAGLNIHMGSGKNRADENCMMKRRAITFIPDCSVYTPIGKNIPTHIAP